jgi:hypothetical protein
MQAIHTALKDIQRGGPVSEGEMSVISLLTESAGMTRRWTTFFTAVVLVAAFSVPQASQQEFIDELHVLAEAGDAEAQVALGLAYFRGSHGAPQDDVKAVRWYRLAAEQGLRSAQYNLGSLMAAGRGVSQDYVEAARLLRLAADQGHLRAHYTLGVMIRDGDGVPQDLAEAVRLFRLVADHGEADAQFNLGFMYGTGHGVLQDYVEAARWYRLAADQGNANAQFNLSIMYANGVGVSRDYVQAYMWLNLAASLMSSEVRDKAAEARDKFANLLTPDQLAEAQRLAREFESEVH